MTKPEPTVDLGYPTEPFGRIPAFQNIEEEAEFWETHDFTEFLGVELHSINVVVNPELGDRHRDTPTSRPPKPS